MKRLAHWLFAWVLATEHDFGRALNEADTAVALAPYDGDVYGDLALLLITAGNLEKGMQWNDLARPRDPGGLKSQNYKKGLALRCLGKYEIRSQPSGSRRLTRTGTRRLHVAIALVRLGRH